MKLLKKKYCVAAKNIGFSEFENVLTVWDELPVIYKAWLIDYVLKGIEITTDARERNTRQPFVHL